MCGGTEETPFLLSRGSWKQALNREDVSEVLWCHKTH